MRTGMTIQAALIILVSLTVMGPGGLHMVELSAAASGLEWVIRTVNSGNEAGRHSVVQIATQDGQTGIHTATSTGSINEPTTSQCTPTLFDDMDSFDATLWHKADWSNGGSCFSAVTWLPDQISHTGSLMTITLDDQGCPTNCRGRPYVSGEYRSNGFYGYGRIEGRLKASGVPGMVTSLFIFYATPPNYDNQDEIDIEILGQDPTEVRVNYFKNGAGGHEVVIDLGFDASQGFHTYGFEWSPSAIKWYVDDMLVHIEDGANGPLPTTPGQLMMNLWPCAGDCIPWCGGFTYPGAPVTAQYDWVRYTPLECKHTVYLPLVANGY